MARKPKGKPYNGRMDMDWFVNKSSMRGIIAASKNVKVDFSKEKPSTNFEDRRGENGKPTVGDALKGVGYAFRDGIESLASDASRLYDGMMGYKQTPEEVAADIMSGVPDTPLPTRKTKK